MGRVSCKKNPSQWTAWRWVQLIPTLQTGKLGVVQHEEPSELTHPIIGIDKVQYKLNSDVDDDGDDDGKRIIKGICLT